MSNSAGDPYPFQFIPNNTTSVTGGTTTIFPNYWPGYQPDPYTNPGYMPGQAFPVYPAPYQNNVDPLLPYTHTIGEPIEEVLRAVVAAYEKRLAALEQMAQAWALLSANLDTQRQVLEAQQKELEQARLAVYQLATDNTIISNELEEAQDKLRALTPIDPKTYQAMISPGNP